MVLVFGLMASISFSSGVFASDDKSIDELKEEFESDLLSKIKEYDDVESLEMQAQYEAYKGLSEDEKVKFINYISDSDLTEQVLEEYFKPGKSELSDDISVTESKSSNGGNIITNEISEDIVIEEYTSDQFGDNNLASITGNNTLAAQDRVANYKKTVKYLGVSVYQHTSTLNYTRTKHGGTITKVRGSDHRITRNFTLNAVKYSGKTSGHTKTSAYSQTNMATSILFKGTWTYWDGKARISVNNKGKVTGYVRSS